MEIKTTTPVDFDTTYAMNYRIMYQLIYKALENKYIVHYKNGFSFSIFREFLENEKCIECDVLGNRLDNENDLPMDSIMDTNGWEKDWYICFLYKDNIYEAWGSMYYGSINIKPV